MKFLNEKIQIDSGQEVLWGDVESLRLLNGKLVLSLKNKSVLEIKDLNPRIIDHAFRSYEQFLQQQRHRR